MKFIKCTLQVFVLSTVVKTWFVFSLFLAPAHLPLPPTALRLSACVHACMRVCEMKTHLD